MITVEGQACDIHSARSLFKEAAEYAGLDEDWEHVVAPSYLQQKRSVLVYDRGLLVGFFGYVMLDDPETSSCFMVERMLFVTKKMRGTSAATLLLSRAELIATSRGCTAILAGSSLHHNEAAKRLYEAHGFKTNYSFRKEL